MVIVVMMRSLLSSLYELPATRPIVVGRLKQVGLPEKRTGKFADCRLLLYGIQLLP